MICFFASTNFLKKFTGKKKVFTGFLPLYSGAVFRNWATDLSLDEN